MSLKVAINGTGRIGLCACRVLGERSDMELASINTTAPVETLVHLLKYDSTHRGYDAEQISSDTIRIGKQKNVKIYSDRDPRKIPFGKLGVRVVLECTGAFNSLEDASLHLHDGVERVVISAPAENTPTFVFGVNHQRYAGEKVISNASCTTNSLAPLVKVLDEKFGIENALMTTIHSYTNDQNVLDVKHKDIRRARAAAINMIPTSTGAAKAIGLVLPHLKGKLNGFAVRVPTPDVSLVDLSVNFKNPISKELINEAMRESARTTMSGLILVDEDKRVSSDFISSPYSAIFVPDCTVVIGDRSAKVLAWYDNEMGYSHRLVDMAHWVGTH